MIGFVFLIWLFVEVVSRASKADQLPTSAPYSFAGILLAVGVVAGFILVRTVGIAAVGATAGGVVGAVVALFHDAPASAPGFLLIAVVGTLVQNLQKGRVLAAGGRM